MTRSDSYLSPPAADISSAITARMEPMLQSALRRWRLSVAAELAEMMAQTTQDDQVAEELHLLGRGCLNYHAYLQSLSRELSPPALIFGTDTELGSRLRRTQRSLDYAFDDSLRSAGGAALVQLLFAYYGLVQLDGFRTLWWLDRCLETARQIEPLPPALKVICRVVTQNLAASLNPERKRPPGITEPYGWFEQTSQHVAQLLKLPRSGMEELDRFVLTW